MESGKSNRQAFRFDDLMKIRLRLLDDETSAEMLDNFHDFRMRYSLNAHMKNQREQRVPRLQKIKKRDPETAKYLEYLEMLIVQLAERVDENSETLADVHEWELLVNLSATGARFATTMPMKEGQYVELGMLLRTIDTQVMVLAEVLRVVPEEEGDGSSVSLKFAQIHPDDTEAIVRHLARLQQEQLRARRAG